MVDRPYEIVVFSLYLAYCLVHWSVHRALEPRLPPDRLKLLRLASLGVLGFVSVGISIELIHWVAAHVPLPYYVRSHWRMFSTLWVFCSVVGYACQWTIRRLASRRTTGDSVDHSRRRLLGVARTAVAAAPFAAIGYGIVRERTNVLREHVVVPVAGLHPDLERIRIAQISDIHLSPTLSEAELARMVDMVNELRPDLVFVTGDLITKRVDPLHLCLRQLKRLKPGIATLGCMGNHESYAGIEAHLTKVGPGIGVDFLRQQNRQFRFGNAVLNIAGVDYQPIERGPSRYLRGCEQLVVEGATNLLLSHNPDVLPVAARQGYDLTLSGHMHGGQVTVEILHPWGSIARFYSPYVAGLYELRENGRIAWGYVNRGLGTIGVPVRIGSPPEITILQLRREEPLTT